VTVPAPGRYRLDATRSTIVVRTRHLFGLGTVRGTFLLSGGELVVADRVEESRVEATAAADSFTSGNAGRDRRVSSKAFLDAQNHPSLAFTSRSVVKTGGSWVARGTLTVRGEGVPFELTVTDTNEQPGAQTVVATGTVDRYAHGITGARGFAGRYLEVTITAVASTGA
jgi:polyisoprenoid-binding protein YceI